MVVYNRTSGESVHDGGVRQLHQVGGGRRYDVNIGWSYSETAAGAVREVRTATSSRHRQRNAIHVGGVRELLVCERGTTHPNGAVPPSQ